VSFATLYRVSFYLMLVFATVILNVDANDNPLAAVYPVVVACAAVIALLTVDRRPGTGLNAMTTNLLALSVTGLVVAEYLFDDNLLLLALGHWFVYFQLIYMFRDKTVDIDWHMFLLGLVQVLVGTVLSQIDAVGALLFCWAVLALWVLGLFSLQRDAIRARRDMAAGASRGSDHDLYPGLLNLAFLWSAVKVTLTTLALGGIIFLAMPRRLSMARSQRGETRAQHLTGFEEEVRLGQIGEILEDDTEVMRVELFDGEGNSVSLNEEPLWRGVTMAIYENGKWLRQGKNASTFPAVRQADAPALGPNKAQGILRQRIKLEANDSSALFGLRPMFNAEANRRLNPEFNARDGTIVRSDSRPGVYDYEVYSYRDATLPQRGEKSPTLHQKYILLGVPETIRPRFQALAESILAKSPESTSTVAKARAIEAHLRDSGEFFYSLKLASVDADLDPVEDFLFNRKEGHCEYFASALALLLRSVGIHARMVNGFKGGDWNYAAQAMTVRQKHAHSWVEVYLGEPPPPENYPTWITLDPTPSIERQRSVARVGGFGANFRQITDFVSFVWVYYIAGYDAERQQRLIYGPLRALAEEARKGFALMGKGLARARDTLITMVTFPNARSVISARGFLVAFVGLLLLVGLVRLLGWFARRIWKWFRGPVVDPLAAIPGAAQYRRFAALLAEFRVERQAAETQEEFAQRATAFLSGRGSADPGVTDVPRRVVEAYYRVRFGDKPLEPRTIMDLEARLDALEASLRGAPA
jgi:transglutaminase-like putative cysteine protease